MIQLGNYNFSRKIPATWTTCWHYWVEEEEDEEDDEEEEELAEGEGIRKGGATEGSDDSLGSIPMGLSDESEESVVDPVGLSDESARVSC